MRPMPIRVRTRCASATPGSSPNGGRAAPSSSPACGAGGYPVNLLVQQTKPEGTLPRYQRASFSGGVNMTKTLLALAAGASLLVLALPGPAGAAERRADGIRSNGEATEF